MTDDVTSKVSLEYSDRGDDMTNHYSIRSIFPRDGDSELMVKNGRSRLTIRLLAEG